MSATFLPLQLPRHAAQGAAAHDGSFVRGLTKEEADGLLDWLRAKGYPEWESSWDGEGFVVAFRRPEPTA